MKKVFGVSTFLVSMLTLVSASDGIATGMSKGMSQIIGIIEGMLGPFFSAILGGESGMLFEKILFLAIILATVYLIIKNMPVFKGNGAIIWIVSISISLLSTRFMSGDLLKTMLLPYSALGVALTSIFPLLIFFAFVEGQAGRTVRKSMWIFYIVVFCTIWSARYATVGAISYIYMGSAVLALLFFLMDGTIQRARMKQKLDENTKEEVAEAIAIMKERIKQINEWQTNGHMDKDTAQRKIKNINKQIDNTLKRA